jgi:hypothetical protein
MPSPATSKTLQRQPRPTVHGYASPIHLLGMRSHHLKRKVYKPMNSDSFPAHAFSRTSKSALHRLLVQYSTELGNQACATLSSSPASNPTIRHKRSQVIMNNKGLEALANLASASTTQANDGNIATPASINERAAQAALSDNPLQPQANSAQAVSLNSLSTQQLQQLLNATGIGNTAHNILNAANLNMLGLQQPVQQPQPETSLLSQLAYLQQMLGRAHSHAVNPFNSNPLLFSGLQGAQQEQIKGKEGRNDGKAAILNPYRTSSCWLRSARTLKNSVPYG